MSANNFLMNTSTQRILLTLVGTIASIILAVMLVWYSKNTITKTMSKRHILRMLKTDDMHGKELAESAKECQSSVISPRLVPVMLTKLQEEGLIQQTGNNKYVITTKGLESLNSLDSMSEEFQKLAKIMQKTSTISKFMVNEVIDRITMISNIGDTADGKQEAKTEVGIPAFSADKQ